MIKSPGFWALSLFIVVSLADVSSGNATVDHPKRNHKKDVKHEYYLNRHVDHPDVDAETIEKHGATLEDAKMQADGLSEPKSKKVKVMESKVEEELKLQEIHGEERQQHQRRHHRHETKVHEEVKSESSTQEEEPKKEVAKEKKSIKNKKHSEPASETSKFEEPKVDSNGTEAVKPIGGKRNHDKRRKGHKHGFSGHKGKKYGGKKPLKPFGKPSKEKKAKRNRKSNN